MLPGLRILFAITLLSVSVVIFGLGAAAFLRSAHEDVANAPWRPIETPATARVDLAPTTLSMLRVEPEATIATLTARADAAAAIEPPAEAKPENATRATPLVTPEPPRAEQASAPVPAKAPEPAAVVQADPPPAAPTTAATVEPAREQSPAVADAKPAETKAAEATTSEAKPLEAKPLEAKPLEAKSLEAKPSETRTLETKAAAPIDAQSAPTAVAALNTEKAEQTQAKSAFEPTSAPQESLDALLPAEASAGMDTLKADDKAIKTAPAAKVAALTETVADETPPLPSKEVMLPTPRVDPAVIEARRKHQQQLVAQQRARARAAAKARRVAAARRAAAQAKAAAAATNPFGAPANSSTNNIRAN